MKTILFSWLYIPTWEKRRQYNAATIGNGIEANTAPNFPAYKENTLVHKEGK